MRQNERLPVPVILHVRIHFRAAEHYTWYPITSLHGALSQKTTTRIFKVVKIFNLALFISLCKYLTMIFRFPAGAGNFSVNNFCRILTMVCWYWTNRHQTMDKVQKYNSFNFSVHHRVRNGSGAHPASYPISTRGSFPGGIAVGAWSWPLTFV
jgi:hypothetical protein